MIYFENMKWVLTLDYRHIKVFNFFKKYHEMHLSSQPKISEGSSQIEYACSINCVHKVL